MNKTKKFIIIDGSSLLSTSFYGTAKQLLMAKTPEEKEKAFETLLKTSTGIYTNGVYTFMKILLNIIQNQKPTHLAIVWDVTRDSFRRNMFKEYKGTRKDTPSPLTEQFITTQNLLDGIIPQFMSKKYLPNGEKTPQESIFEADDFAGSLTKHFENKVPVVLYTKDEDYLQLVSHNSRVWLVTSKSEELFNEVGINKKEFNIPDGVFEYTLTTLRDIKQLDPYQIIEYKALCGDKSDNIPGVKGVGEKSVIPLINEYSTIETIYDTIENLTSKEEKDLKKFFKEELDISRSPISNLLTEGVINLSNGKKLTYRCINEIFTESEIDLQKIIKSKINQLRFPIEITSPNGISELQQNTIVSIEYSAKEMAFLSKELATIKTDVNEIKNLKLDDISLNIDYDKLNSRLLELEIKSLL